MGLELFDSFVADHYEIHEWKHATAILKTDFMNEWQDIVGLLHQFRLYKSWITVGGGRKSKVAEAIDSRLYRRGWCEKQFKTKVVGESIVI